MSRVARGTLSHKTSSNCVASSLAEEAAIPANHHLIVEDGRFSVQASSYCNDRTSGPLRHQVEGMPTRTGKDDDSGRLGQLQQSRHGQAGLIAPPVTGSPAPTS